MGMSIDEALKIIKDGRIVATIIKGNNEDDTRFNQENIEALNMIANTMHKYQIIVNDLKACEQDGMEFISVGFLKEIVDGKID